MEQTLNSTPGLDTMRSTTVPGLSAIQLIFRRGTDPLEARQLVNERVATAIPSLPSSAGIPWTLQPLSATSRALKIGLTCDHCNLTDLSMIAYWTIRWRLMAVPGVANVSIWGQRERQLHVRVEPERPVVLLRRGKSGTWLVSARGRVMRELKTPKLSSLPRVWIPAATTVSVGETLAPSDGGLAAAALAPLSRGTFPSAVRTVRESGRELTFVLRSGLEIRLGGLGDLRLKLAIARRIMHAVDADSSSTGYLDVSVPERPVIAGSNAQLSTGGLG
jgi:hypothetical protein